MAAHPRTSDARTDGELALAAQTGGPAAQAAFAAIYDRFGDPIFGFAASVLRNPTEAADALQDIFIVAMQRIGTLQEPEKLRAWLFSIARFDTMARVRKRARVSDREVPDMASTDRSPEQVVAADEVAAVVWDAVLGLNERDRAVIELNVRGGLEGAELAEALGMSPSASYVVLSRAKDQMARAVGALLLARGGRKDCEELAELVADWDGRYTPLIRKRVSRHAEDCDVCSRRAVAVTRALSALAAVPVLAPPAGLRELVLGRLSLAGGSASPLLHGDRNSGPRATHWNDIAWSPGGFPEGELIEDPASRLEDQGSRSAPTSWGRRIVAAAAAIVILGGAGALIAKQGHRNRPPVIDVANSPPAVEVADTAQVTDTTDAPATNDPLGVGATTVPASSIRAPTVLPASDTSVAAATAKPSTAAASTASTTAATTTPSTTLPRLSPTTTLPGGSNQRMSGPSLTSSARSRATTTRAVGLRLASTTAPARRPATNSTTATTEAVSARTAAINESTTTQVVTSVPIPSTTGTEPSPSTLTTFAPTTVAAVSSVPPAPVTTLETTTVATTTSPAATTSPATITTTSPSATTTSLAATTTTVGASTTTRAASTTQATTTTLMLQILTADHNPDSIRAVPCAIGPNETTLLVTITGGTAPFTATALISNGTEVSMAPTGGSSFKATVGSFKANAVGSYTWSAKVSDANGSVASKNNGSKFVVVACG